MIVLYGWRRVVQGRQLGLYQTPAGRMGRGGGVRAVGLGGLGGGASIGERPVLWDMRADTESEKGKGVEQGAGWADIMPISMSITRRPPVFAPTKSPSASTPAVAYANRLHSYFHSPKTPAPNAENPAPPRCARETMQVTVAIAMPTRYRHHDPGECPEDVLQYSLGVLQVPWLDKALSQACTS
ncbi:hypothetical protein HWV62_24850 [Athelia sp. TMB]|nr:hypothetical protein HWV62_24850 [Athelia sp. TMB]